MALTSQTYSDSQTRRPSRVIFSDLVVSVTRGSCHFVLPDEPVDMFPVSKPPVPPVMTASASTDSCSKDIIDEMATNTLSSMSAVDHFTARRYETTTEDSLFSSTTTQCFLRHQNHHTREWGDERFIWLLSSVSLFWIMFRLAIEVLYLVQYDLVLLQLTVVINILDSKSVLLFCDVMKS